MLHFSACPMDKGVRICTQKTSKRNFHGCWILHLHSIAQDRQQRRTVLCRKVNAGVNHSALNAAAVYEVTLGIVDQQALHEDARGRRP